MLRFIIGFVIGVAVSLVVYNYGTGWWLRLTTRT